MTTATSRLTIDLGAVAANYTRLSQTLTSGQAAGVVKANAYGLGVDLVAPVLDRLGCPFFFVATLDEAVTLRGLTQKPIAVLGSYLPGNEATYTAHGLTPVMNSAADITQTSFTGDAIWHIDTGMNRLGLRPEDVPALLNAHASLPFMLMTHFACADERGHALTQAQGMKFMEIAAQVRARKPDLKISMCNSSALFMNPDWHNDLVRPGMALYGLNPTPDLPNPMRRTVTLEARLLQIKPVMAGETVGYAASHTMTRNGRIGITGIGYADGLPRSGSNRAKFYWQGQPCPVLGRISMDLIAVDLSHLPDEAVRTGDWLEILGPHQSPDQLAADCGTIGYEILTSLGQRSERIVIPA